MCSFAVPSDARKPVPNAALSFSAQWSLKCGSSRSYVDGAVLWGQGTLVRQSHKTVSTDHIIWRKRWIEFEGFAETGPNLLCNMGYNTQLRLTRVLNFDFSDPYCPAPPALEEHRSLWPQARERAAVLRDRLPAGGVTCWISSPNFTTGQQSKHNNRSTFETQLDW